MINNNAASENQLEKNKAENTATPAWCGGPGAIFGATRAFGQEQ